MQKKPTLIFVSEYYTQTNNAPAARFKPIIDEFQRKFEVVIITSKGGRKINPENQIKIQRNIIPFPDNTKRLVLRLLGEVSYAFETFFRLLFTKGSIYYITSPSFINCISACVCCILLSRKYIVDIRDDYPRVYFEHNVLKPTSIFGKVLLRLESLLYRKALIVIAATEGLQKSIQEKYKGEIYLYRNGFSEAIFVESKNKYEIFTLVFHGTLGYFQDLDLLIQIGHLIDTQPIPIRILVIGKGSEDYKLKTNNLPKCLQYLGSKPYKDIPELINKSHIGLSFRKPGRITSDSFPVKIYEYIGVSLPIINTPLSEAGTFIKENQIGYQFDKADAKSIVDSILHLIENDLHYNEIVHNISKIRELFSNEKNAAKLAVYVMNKIS